MLGVITLSHDDRLHHGETAGSNPARRRFTTMKKPKDPTERICSKCGKRLVAIQEFAEWCSSYGDQIPWLTEEDVKKGLTYEMKYPLACGYKLMFG